jgi:hypothetical protein
MSGVVNRNNSLGIKTTSYETNFGTFDLRVGLFCEEEKIWPEAELSMFPIAFENTIGHEGLGLKCIWDKLSGWSLKK